MPLLRLLKDFLKPDHWHWLPNRSDITAFYDNDTKLDLYGVTSGFHGAFAMPAKKAYPSGHLVSCIFGTNRSSDCWYHFPKHILQFFLDFVLHACCSWWRWTLLYFEVIYKQKWVKPRILLIKCCHFFNCCSLPIMCRCNFHRQDVIF